MKTGEVHFNRLKIPTEFTQPDPEPWMERRNCAGIDPEIFFERVNAVNPPARKYCDPCPVQHECLIFALLKENPSETRYGIFGNTSPIDRSKLYDVLKGRDNA